MTRINTNVPSLIAQNRLRASNEDLQTSLTRLSTGLRINSGSDDPAGLIASETLRSEVTSLSKAISNTRRASQIISTADSALGQVSNLLNDIRGLVVEAANDGALSDEEVAANQLQIDSSLEAINRIAQTTTFQGRKLLDGSLDFISTANNVETIRDISIDQANLGTAGAIAVDVNISAAAEKGSIQAGTGAFSAASAANATSILNTQSANVTVAAGHEFDIQGPSGLTSIQLVSDAAHDAAPAANYNVTTGILTVTVDDATTATTDDIVAEINATDGFVAATTAGDGTGVLAADVTTTPAASQAGIRLTAVQTGSGNNNVSINYASGPVDGVVYDETNKELIITLNGAKTLTEVQSLVNAFEVEGQQLFAADFVDGAGAPDAGLADLRIDLSLDEIELVNTETTGGEVISSEIVFQINGSNGAETFNFGAGTSSTQIAAAINLVRDSTGVAASADATGLTLETTAYGSEALINVDVISEGFGGTFEDNLNSFRDTGSDVVATVNGVEASGKANTLSINTSILDLTITVDDESDRNFSFSITGGGALFQLGPDVTSNQQARLGIGSLSTGQLSGASGRLYELGSGQDKSLIGDINSAGQIIDEVINQVTSLRGRLGAFQATSLESNLISLGETVSNLQEAESSIRDADFAVESANLTRSQILVQSGTNVLSLANQNPQNVLSLLR